MKPVYNGPVLSGHPLLSGQFSKFRFFAHTNAVFVTCIRQPPCSSPVFVFPYYLYLYYAATEGLYASGGHPETETKPYIILYYF